ncbi:DNA-binding HxlR family transcriptional regulator [Nocardioides ginsengisegetis]|uniref:DNA-binding HxlR family transcriptional regulator n=1 Tax=Nocardioides ginsengisegetis TaxID=661491 RepID=A0A7W3J002_9ACTN|nr:DNA-binding HxlR family transcriptional regulator [Nocardioides ginsengisegetis]
MSTRHQPGSQPGPLAALPGRPCPIAASLEVVGERWSLLVIREIAMGSRRFTDIVRGTGAPRDRISVRLKALEDAGVVAREEYQPSPARHEYVLTEAGRELVPILDSLLAWGLRHAVAEDDPDRMTHYKPVTQRLEEHP